MKAETENPHEGDTMASKQGNETKAAPGPPENKAGNRLNMSSGAERRLAMTHIRNAITRDGPTNVKKEQLAAWADDIGLDVKRQDGGDGEPTKGDYLKALGF